jgi:hypothetical protein
VYTDRKEVKGVGVWTLASALGSDKDMHDMPIEPQYHIKTSPNWTAPWSRTAAGSDVENLNDETAALAKTLIKKSPNLTLNVKGAIPGEIQVWIFTLMGALVQALVFVFNALVVYYYRWPRAGYVVASYGYPIWACGTIFITIGVCLCARVVEYSTTESIVEPLSLKGGPSAPQQASSSQDIQQKSDATRENTGFHVVRLQKKISAMNLQAFAIFNDEKNPRVVISRRTLFPPGPTSINFGSSECETEDDETKPDPKSTLMAITTAIGTALTLIGFVCQNIGTRELHWSGGVAQLGATLVLVLLRAWLRRHVGDPPSKPTKLKSGFEASHLSSNVHRVNRFMIHTGMYQNPEIVQPPAQKLTDGSPNATKDIEGNNLRLFLGKVTLREPPKVNDLSRTTELDTAFEVRVMVFRVLKSQLIFSEIQPGSTEINDIATRVYDTMETILTLLGIGTLWWYHKISFKGNPGFTAAAQTISSVSPLEGLINLELRAWEKAPKLASYNAHSRGECIDAIRAVLSLTMYHYSKSRAGKQALKTNDYLFIVGCCQVDDIGDIPFEQKQKAITHFSWLNTPDLTSWSRGSDGKMNPIPFRTTGEVVFHERVFGMHYSAIKHNKNG